MKAKDFVIPFKFEKRRPVIINRLLYVPLFYEEHKKFKEKISFEKKAPINIEYCSGNGQWIIERAKRYPEINWIAVEMRFDRARKIWVKMHNENLKNLFVVLSEAKTFSKYYLDESSIDEMFINFPDPWPKKKHEKNRLIQKDFIDELSRILKNNTEITLVTDDETYLKQMIDVFLKNQFFKPVYKDPYFVSDVNNFGASFFDNLWREKKRTIKHLKFKKSKSG